MTLREVAEKFVELSTWIRELSSPQIANSEDAASYREELLTNFRRIGDIAQIKTGLLNDYLMPALDSNRLLTEEEVVVLRDLRENLMDAYVMDNMDAPTIYRVARRKSRDRKVALRRFPRLQGYSTAWRSRRRTAASVRSRLARALSQG